MIRQWPAAWKPQIPADRGCFIDVEIVIIVAATAGGNAVEAKGQLRTNIFTRGAAQRRMDRYFPEVHAGKLASCKAGLYH